MSTNLQLRSPSAEPPCHELRQAVPLPEAVLQEGDHEKDREEPAAGLPVLPPLPSVGAWLLTGKRKRDRVWAKGRRDAGALRASCRIYSIYMF